MKSWKTTLFQAAAVTGLVAYGASAQANPGSSENMLTERIDALEAQLAQLLILQDEKPAEAEAPAAKSEGMELEASWKHGLKLSSADGKTYVKLFGRIQWDALFFQEDREIKNTLGKQADGVLGRRARIGVSGRLHEHVIFKGEYDFAGGAPAYTDVWIGLDKLPVVGPYINSVIVGHQKVPFGLESNVSSRHITFMERGLTDALDFGRDTGLALYGGMESGSIQANWGIGVFKSVPATGTVANNGEWYVALRETNKIAVNDDMYICAGASVMMGSPSGDAVTWTDPTELNGGKSATATATLAAKSEYRVGLEAAVVFKALTFQSEIMYAKVERPSSSTLDDAEPWAAYVQASYFLTGERRPWKNGKFERVVPNSNLFDGGYGALEVALRYSHLDLSNGDLAGNRLNNSTIGVNWYMNANTKLMVNLLSESVTPPAGQGGRIYGLGIRFQVDF